MKKVVLGLFILLICGYFVFAGGDEIKRLTKMASRGDAISQNNLGVAYSNGEGVAKNYEEAVKWYKLAAEQDYSIAQGNLGICYYNGFGIAQDYKLAARWFQKAADQGDAQAQYNLGHL